MVWAPEAPWLWAPWTPWVPGSTWAPWAMKPDRTCSTETEGRTFMWKSWRVTECGVQEIGREGQRAAVDGVEGGSGGEDVGVGGIPTGDQVDGRGVGQIHEG